MKTTEHPLKPIRRAGVPLVAIETADPAQTIIGCIKSLMKSDDIPIFQWDIVNGHRGINKLGLKVAASIGAEPIQEPYLFLQKVGELGCKIDSERKSPMENALVFVHMGNRYLNNETVIQAIWNLRDILKSIGATVVLLCANMMLPAELQQDVVIITEPLPDATELGVIVDSTLKDAGIDLAKITPAERTKIIDILLGISAFAAEQTLAMSIDMKGQKVNMDSLWERKRKMVEQTPGLTVWRGGSSFNSIGGLGNIKDFLSRILSSAKNPVRCIGFIDEIEKMFAGASGDLSGVSQDQLMVFLKEMQDSNIPGIILIGAPGTGKSAIAKAAGSIADAEVLAIDTGAMTGSLVGESQSKIRKAMATFKAVSQGKGMFIATCNKIASLPPELRRRFTLGTFYVDLPDKDERKVIWDIWRKEYKLDADQLPPDDEGWTGAEIRNCCDVADRTGVSLFKAAEFIVPVSKSASDQVEGLRKMASGRFISASKPGIYTYEGGGAVTGRKFEVQQTTTIAEVQQEEKE